MTTEEKEFQYLYNQENLEIQMKQDYKHSSGFTLIVCFGVVLYFALIICAFTTMCISVVNELAK
jgi:quinol-cytochrome oxidoreductase complex cytochrome b subunit